MFVQGGGKKNIPYFVCVGSFNINVKRGGRLGLISILLDFLGLNGLPIHTHEQTRSHAHSINKSGEMIQAAVDGVAVRVCQTGFS